MANADLPTFAARMQRAESGPSLRVRDSVGVVVRCEHMVCVTPQHTSTLTTFDVG